MYQILVISSTEGNSLDSLNAQIKYIEQFEIKTTLLIDPDEFDVLKTIEKNNFNGAYVHIKRRINSQYDIVKLLESHNIQLIGSSYITNLMVSDKCLTSLKSGIGLPNVILTRNSASLDRIPYNEIQATIKYPVIVKPNTMHASQGISVDSVAFNNSDLKKIINKTFERFQSLNELLIEHFAQTGIEYTVSVLGNKGSTVCAVNKICYKQRQNVNLYSEEDKQCPLDKRTMYFSIEKDEYIRSRLEYHAKTLFEYLNLKDFARFDMIYDQKFYLIEANSSPIPGNSFSWEWQIKYNIKNEQIIALMLCAFHFGQIVSGRVDNLPQSLINSQPAEIIEHISHPDPVNVCPECSGPTDNCYHPEFFTMNSRVGSETEVSRFLYSLVYLTKPSFIVETGTFKGDGTISLAEGLLKNKFGHMITIEVDPMLADIAKKNLSGYPVEVFCGNSLNYIPSEPIDLLFLDSKRILRKEEFIRFKPYLHKKSIIIWHDSSYRKQNHAVFDAVNELYSSGIIDRLLLPTPRGITLSMLR